MDKPHRSGKFRIENRLVTEADIENQLESLIDLTKSSFRSTMR